LEEEAEEEDGGGDEWVNRDPGRGSGMGGVVGRCGGMVVRRGGGRGEGKGI